MKTHSEFCPNSGRDERLYTRVLGVERADSLKLVAGPPRHSHPLTASQPGMSLTPPTPPTPPPREERSRDPSRNSSIAVVQLSGGNSFTISLLSVEHQFLPSATPFYSLLFLFIHYLILTRQESSSCQPGQEPFLHLSLYLSGYAQNRDSPG